MTNDGRKRRLPIARVEAGRLGDRAPAERARLTEACYELWSEFFEGMTRERFVATHLFDDTWVGAAYGIDGRLAGFYNLNTMHIDVEGERSLVLTSGAFVRLEYDAVPALKRSGLLAVLRVRVRHPFARLAFVPIATTPVAYRAMGESMHCFYPHPSRTTPAYVPAALREVCRRRNLVVPPGTPFVVDFAIRQRKVDAIKRTASVQRPNDDTRYFLATVPRWEAGHALLVWVPGDLQNILRSGVLLARRSLR